MGVAVMLQASGSQQSRNLVGWPGPGEWLS